MIKAVIFDWGGVLIENPAPELIANCSKSLKLSTERFTEAFKKYIHAFQTGAIGELELWKKLCRETGGTPPGEKSLWRPAFEASYRPINEMFSLAEKLQKHGIKTALLSNTEKEAMEFFHEQNYQCFDNLIFSCQEGVAKPDEDIYKLTIQKIGVPPQNILFIDDKKENTEAASALGFQTILCKNPGQVRKIIKSSIPGMRSL